MERNVRLISGQRGEKDVLRLWILAAVTSIWILLIAHFLADFSFRTEKKTADGRHLLRHAAVYALTVGAAAFCCLRTEAALKVTACIALTHGMIDWLRIEADRAADSRKFRFASFIADQLLHISIILVLARVLGLEACLNAAFASLASGIPMERYLRYALIFVILFDPAAIFVKVLSEYVAAPNEAPSSGDEPPVGRVIGKLERIIVAVLVLNGQLGGIGLVLTAKSVARFKQFDDRDFAERYLIGTLSSIGLAMIVTLLLKSAFIQ